MPVSGSSPLGKEFLSAPRSALKPMATAKPPKAEDVKGDNGDQAHVHNFIEAVRGNEPALCPIEVGQRSTTAVLLGNVAMDLGRSIQWDPVEQCVKDDPEANRLLRYTYRSPYRWPTVS